MKPSDLKLVAKARLKGARYAWSLMKWARRSGVRFTLALAICEQESHFQNVYGHDPTIAVGWGRVTKSNYLAYKRMRGPSGKGGMQGVGPMQLTWWEFQDKADALGGCWKPGVNIRVGLELLASLIHDHGPHVGVARYNGSGAQAENYAREVEAKQRAWSRRLFG